MNTSLTTQFLRLCMNCYRPSRKQDLLLTARMVNKRISLSLGTDCTKRLVIKINTHIAATVHTELRLGYAPSHIVNRLKTNLKYETI